MDHYDIAVIGSGPGGYVAAMKRPVGIQNRDYRKV